MPYFVQGLTMGLAYVAPIGVQNLFVIHSALAHPRRRALATAGIVILFDVTLALAAFVVTWCNPQALIDGTMMLGAFRATLPTAQASSFISGVALASCLWFLGVTLVVSLLSRHFTPGVMVWINRVCGVVILCYGGSLLWSFLTMLG